MQGDFVELTAVVREAGMLDSCAGLLGWDERTYMPPGGAAHRGEQMGLLARLAHERRSSPRLGELLARLEAGLAPGDEGDVAVTVREVRRSHDRAHKIPARLVEELARVTTQAQQVWQEARKNNDFPAFLPWLEKIVRLKQEEAQAVGYRDTPYDALLDEFEPGEKTARLTELFADLRARLTPLVQAIQASPARPNGQLLHRSYPVDAQRALGEEAARAIGFDFQRGRLDVTTHPFCSGIGPGDCRITTRFNPRFFNESFFGILHEAGHAIYEQGLPAGHFGLPLGTATSLGVHESQSRFWENQVGRGRPFWEYFYPRARQAFPEALGDVALDDFHFAINAVETSYIRVEADEVTYNLHIILRFELEQALIRGDLLAADVPAAWNERFEKSFQRAVPDDAHGCLQDIHWSGGGIGYFPTYTLGNLFAAQLMQQVHADLGDVAALFRRGDFQPVRGWLNEKVHRHGSRYRGAALVERATGRPPSADPLLDYLHAKYAPLYRL